MVVIAKNSTSYMFLVYRPALEFARDLILWILALVARNIVHKRIKGTDFSLIEDRDIHPVTTGAAPAAVIVIYLWGTYQPKDESWSLLKNTADLLR